MVCERDDGSCFGATNEPRRSQSLAKERNKNCENDRQSDSKGIQFARNALLRRHPLCFKEKERQREGANKAFHSVRNSTAAKITLQRLPKEEHEISFTSVFLVYRIAPNETYLFVHALLVVRLIPNQNCVHKGLVVPYCSK